MLTPNCYLSYACYSASINNGLSLSLYAGVNGGTPPAFYQSPNTCRLTQAGQQNYYFGDPCMAFQSITTEIGAIYTLSINYLVTPLVGAESYLNQTLLGTIDAGQGAKCPLFYNNISCTVNFTAVSTSTMVFGPNHAQWQFITAPTLPNPTPLQLYVNVTLISVVKVSNAPICSASNITSSRRDLYDANGVQVQGDLQQFPFRPPACPTPPPPPPSCIVGQPCTYYGNVTTTLTITGPTTVTGSVQNGATTFYNLQPLSVAGCYESSLTTLLLSQSQIQQVTQSGSTTYTLITQSGSDCAALDDNIFISMPPTGCSQVTAHVESTGDSLNVIFTVNSLNCKIWWIVLASIGGFLVLAILIFIIIYKSSPWMRSKIQPFSMRSQNPVIDQ